MSNPTLSDLVGGIQAVTLGDDEARRRGTQKTVLERKAPPTFDTIIEIEDIDRLAVHFDVATDVDRLLLGLPVSAEVRGRAPARCALESALAARGADPSPGAAPIASAPGSSPLRLTPGIVHGPHASSSTNAHNGGTDVCRRADTSFPMPTLSKTQHLLSV